jgi:hypothetical protein
MKKLEELYYDPKRGFNNVNDLVRKAKEENLGLTREEIKKWYKSQPINQIYYHRIDKDYHSIRAPNRKVGTLQADLMFTEKYKRENKDPKNKSSYKYILTVIDVYSRYAWAFPLMTKTSEEVKEKIKKVIEEIEERHPGQQITLTTDDGGEFKGDVKRYLESKGIQQYLLDPNEPRSLNKKGVIERFNRTLWNKLKKYMTHNKTLKYYDAIDSLIENYNNSLHRTIQEKPIDVYTGRETSKQTLAFPSMKFNVGDYVRRLLNRKMFDKKSFEPIYSTKVYQIPQIKGYQNTLKDIETGKILDRTYLPRELIKVEKPEVNDFFKEFREKKFENKKIKQKVKRLRKDFDKVNEKGEVEIPKRLQPKREKREIKKVKRYGF